MARHRKNLFFLLLFPFSSDSTTHSPRYGSWRDLVHTACLPRRTSPCNDIVLSRRILSTPVLPEKRGGDGKNAITSPSRRDADRSNRNRQRRFGHHSCCNASHVVLSPLLC